MGQLNHDSTRMVVALLCLTFGSILNSGLIAWHSGRSLCLSTGRPIPFRGRAPADGPMSIAVVTRTTAIATTILLGPASRSTTKDLANRFVLNSSEARSGCCVGFPRALGVHVQPTNTFAGSFAKAGCPRILTTSRARFVFLGFECLPPGRSRSFDLAGRRRIPRQIPATHFRS